ncbi:hypothetical protein [Kribbella antiqua]|uniref:Rv1733c family protein n=1 Tax=Kribbella antiqua TaxID=2512217 RepID=UPI00105076A6|nr:hypothetical protein [Kribbella antiqua]
MFVVMQLRRLWLGHNPLRRRVDRLEAALLMIVLVAALLVIPAAAAFGTTIRNRAEHSAAEERAEARPVQVRTLGNTAEAVPSSPGLTTTSVPVRWFDTSGSRHEGKVDVLIGTKAGTELTIWLDRDGAMTRGPRPPADSTALGVAAGVTMPLLAWPLLLASFGLARRPLDHRRAQAWAREWEQVSPRWTRPQY